MPGRGIQSTFEKRVEKKKADGCLHEPGQNEKTTSSVGKTYMDVPEEDREPKRIEKRRKKKKGTEKAKERSDKKCRVRGG